MDIDEKHLLRLGMGEKDLKLSKSYSKNGRINYMLEKRINVYRYKEIINILAPINNRIAVKIYEDLIRIRVYLLDSFNFL